MNILGRLFTIQRAGTLFRLLAVLSLFPLLVILAGMLSPITGQHIQQAVSDNVGHLEDTLNDRVFSFKERGSFLFHKYKLGTLEHGEIRPKEALIIEKDRDISNYFGEIYYFESSEISPGGWYLVELKGDVFFIQKLSPHVYYVRFFLELDDRLLLSNLSRRFSFAELKFSKQKNTPSPEAPGPAMKRAEIESSTGSGLRFDETSGYFIYNGWLESSGKQLMLQLRFSKEEIDLYFHNKQQLSLLVALLLFLLINLCYFGIISPRLHAGRPGTRSLIISRLLWFALLLDLFFLLPMIGDSNLNFSLFPQLLECRTTYQLFIAILFLFSILYFIKDRLKSKLSCILAFTAGVILVTRLVNEILYGVHFLYSDFHLGLDYLSLFFTILLLHLVPLLFLWDKDFNVEANALNLVLFVCGQGALLGAAYYLFDVSPLNFLVFSFILFIFLFSRRTKGFITRLAVLFLIALSMFLLISGNTVKDKKEFITHNLKNIFLNQDNYARFIAREMVHEINSRSTSLYDFFRECSTSDLVDIWRMSIAQRENIASGIFFLSKEGRVMNQYAYQMPFLELHSQKFFPFWAIEETEGELYGKKISLVIASTSVKRGASHLGYIIIQVLNSPRLILRHQENINIFTIDQKINGKDLSYIKLNENNQVIENPSNINLKDMGDILAENDRWIHFDYTGISFTGYIFKHNRNSIIIFFPGNTFFKDFAEIVKIFLFLAMIFLLFYFKELRSVEWKAIYYSFSLRVFAILILISLLTAVIFSLFSLDFNIRSSERRLHQFEYEKGRTAQNKIYNLLGEDGEISQERLFLISEIMNSDIGIYEDRVFLDSSNQRKSIESRIPVYLHSRILEQLDKKGRKFVLSDDGYSIFFRVGDYIFHLESSANWKKIVAESSYHTDFIITLFFLLAVVGFSSAFFFRNKILSPIHELNRAMAEVEKGNVETLEQIPSEIEIESLYLGFNSMVQGIMREKKNISEISRMKTIIKLGRRVAHEVKNPLTPIKLSAEQILRSLQDKNKGYEDIIKKSVHFIMDETEHLRKVSYGFLDLAKIDEVMPTAFNLLDLVKEEVFNFGQLYANVEFGLQVDTKKGKENSRYQVVLDKIKIKQVLINLVLNAVEAIGKEQGRIEFILQEEGDGERVSLEVKDNGTGMTGEEVEMAFAIDYSTKDIGTGIGLFVVKRIIDLHKGEIEILSKKNQGTSVILHLPKCVQEEPC